MQATGNKRRKYDYAGILLLLVVLAGVANAAAPVPQSASQLLAHADNIKTADNAAFAKLLQELQGRTAELSEEEKWQLRYMQAYQSAYSGKEELARTQLEALAKEAPDSTLRTKVTGTLINVLGIEHHYDEAFQYLDQALDNLTQVTDKEARFHLLAEASQLLSDAGQHELAASYANQIIVDYPNGRNGCIGRMLELHDKLLGGQTNIAKDQFQEGIDSCLAVGEKMIAGAVRRDMAVLDMQQNKMDDALDLLQKHYEEVKGFNYPALDADYSILLAQIYWKKDNGFLAQKYATATVDIAAKSDFTESLVKSYQLLYEIERQQGNLRDALAYHEKYVAANKEHLDDVREKALAYQIAKQQVETKKIELDALNRRNQILQLQQALDHKAMVMSRLYIALLLTVLASIGFWLYRLKRSQLRFMRLARRDGLTGIFNRQHFVEEAEQALRYVAKSLRGACLILIDLDHFKTINDTYGHIAGDNALKRAVLICQQHLRSSDVFGRIGGEEFGILLPECTLIQALERAERIRLAIQAMPDSETEHVPLTASFGIASTTHYGYELRRLLIAADDALYRAKRDGRNRVVVSMNGHAPDTGNNQARRDKLTNAAPYADSAE
ncbi:diguanylate cyclase [Dyella acidisoli]|uniref:diguanylate cyclase n=1 Tax=Dyella acidisoli TaxID=1867834 RepID=A0ABQ5XQJ6_9GAMM|nr:diguanylate cyclase [Dyella acidisoli]GLQ92841.1 GGDEF domain-containing protein [Dyella acidisoli]